MALNIHSNFVKLNATIEIIYRRDMGKKSSCCYRKQQNIFNINKLVIV